MWATVRSLWFVFAAAASLAAFALSINLQVARIPIASLGLQPDLFNSTRAGSYDPISGTITPMGLYVAPIVTGAGIARPPMNQHLNSLNSIISSFGMKRLSCATMVFLELIWTLLLSLFWMAYAGVVIMGSVFGMTDSCYDNSLCIQVQVLKGLAIGVWLIITGYFLTLLTLASIGLSRGQRRAFVSSARTSDFFVRNAPRMTNDNVAPITSRVQFSRNGNETDAESVYSVPTPVVKPIPVHLDMTSSRSYDAHMASNDWHEMKPVSIDSPSSRMHEKQFTLESDDGEVTDVPLEEDEGPKYHKEKVKAKPLA